MKTAYLVVIDGDLVQVKAVKQTDDEVRQKLFIPVRQKRRISAREFMIAWRNSKSVQEVAWKTTLSVASVGRRARHYRMRGLKLKDMCPPDFRIGLWTPSAN